MVRMPGLFGASGTVDVAPVRTIDAAPPFAASHPVRGPDTLRHIGPEDKGPTPLFGLTYMAGGRNKTFKFRIGYCRCRHQKRCDPKASWRSFAIIGKRGPRCSDKGTSTGHLDKLFRQLPLADRWRWHEDTGSCFTRVRCGATMRFTLCHHSSLYHAARYWPDIGF